ncbi:hypothetical protein CDAR_10681 [Caerostris darwini]|uniref:Uncharacterized protein n=1 Tax=Caerostris darwini TaxID=1538125 RepID=A0AAV4SXR1_9ARAC|nr:hypothetical protein CDAR_10681 [Caerostris darwini]
MQNCKFYSCPDCYTRPGWVLKKKLPSRGDGKVSEKKINSKDLPGYEVGEESVPQEQKKMKTSDIFLADETCLFCEKRKCKYAVTQSEADPLTPLTSVHGIDKKTIEICLSAGDPDACVRLHKVIESNERKKKDSMKVPSQNSPPVPFHAELQVLFLSGLLHGTGWVIKKNSPSRGNVKNCKFYSCPDCYTCRDGCSRKTPSRGNGKVSEKKKNKQQRSPFDMRVVKKVSHRNRKKLKTSDIFLGDKTCLFCEKRKCKYAITQSEANPLTSLKSVHGIDKVFRLLYAVARNCTECAALGLSWISHLEKWLPENIPKILRFFIKI